MGVKEERQPVFLHFQQRKELLIVIIVGEDRLAIIASSNHVIETAIELLELRQPRPKFCQASRPFSSRSVFVPSKECQPVIVGSFSS